MFLRKKGLPHEGELVLCTVTKIQPHGVFVRLDEYEDKSGMIHISEIAPGRIRNIRDFVKEGKVVVCSILRINRERGYIDLSLRRVSEIQKRNKTNEIKQQQKIEKLLEQFAKDAKLDLPKLVSELSSKVLTDYDSLFHCFEDISAGEYSFKDKLGTDYAEKLEEFIKTRIKPTIVEVGGTLKISSYASEGINVIKEGLTKAQEVGGSQTTIRYLGGGAYHLAVQGEDYKQLEGVLDKVIASCTTYFKQNNAVFEFTRSHE